MVFLKQKSPTKVDKMDYVSISLFLILIHQVVGVVRDVTPPQVSKCPSTRTATAPVGQYGTTIIWDEPVATDDSEVTITKSHQSGVTEFYIGSTYVTYVFIDSYYNVAQCQFIVKVTSPTYPYYDFTPPILRCPPNQEEYVAPGSPSARVSYSVETSDNSGDDVSTYFYPPSGSLFRLGVSRVWVFASDESYNQAYCFFDVAVSESEDICLPNPCPDGKVCYRNNLNTRYTCNDNDLASGTQRPTVGCRHPGTIQNGMVLPNRTDPYPLGSKVMLTCQDEYLLDGATEIYCTDQMTWSSDLPSCVRSGKSEGTCQSVRYLFGGIIGSIIGILLVEVIIYAIYRIYTHSQKKKLNRIKKPSTSSSARAPTSHIYDNNPRATVTANTSAPPPYSTSINGTIHSPTNSSVNNSPSRYEGLDPASRERDHKYETMTDSAHGRNDNAQMQSIISGEQDNEDGDGYMLPDDGYLEIIP